MNLFTNRLYRHVFLIGFLTFLTGILLGIVIFSFLWRNTIWPKSSFENDREIRSGQADLINPLLECSYSDNKELKPFEDELQYLVNEEKQKGLTTNISVVFRDLLSGARVDINPEDKYVPASLLKVPVMMAYYKAAEIGPTILQREIKYDKEIASDYAEENNNSKLKIGASYSVENLIEEMIVRSDNIALSLLGSLGEGLVLFDKLNEDLGINIKEIGPENDFLGVVKYSSFFRILYNSSYLSPEMSNRALNLLTKTTFREAINKNFPKELKVAHKYGTRNLKNGLIEVHDCGIVYYPNRPYLVCVMTKGKSIMAQEESIQRISDEIYRQVVASTN